ncbi:hypothetical protein XENOCAPTIV_020918 [Xenoophorus captivus]|uniref:Uncharacterized protein n=1 Tax=Xenoophorus captivus TaxID=1517983 RepID=A0ABV0QJD5_9TELE
MLMRFIDELIINSVGTSRKRVLSVSCFGASRCVFTRHQAGNSSKQKLLLPISLGRIIRSSPNYVKSIVLQRGRLFLRGKHLRHLPVFPGVDVQQIQPKVRA